MRILLITLLTVLLAGCFAPPAPQSTSYVKIYQSRDELVGVKYHEVGIASGSSCQLLQQDRPATISDARADMQRHAARMGDAVILGRCETLNGLAGCYRSTVCEGTVIKINSSTYL
jgi:RcsF protein